MIAKPPLLIFDKKLYHGCTIWYFEYYTSNTHPPMRLDYDKVSITKTGALPLRGTEHEHG